MSDTDNSAQRVCFDRILPRDLRLFALPSSTFADEMALLMAKRWPVGSTLRIKFMGGTTAQQDLVKQHAPDWGKHGNLKFAFGNDADSEIRIAFNPGDGAWSYIGTDCLDIPRDQPTMNLGWQDRAVILHEFGHAIGLIHEHQNPTGGIQWNRAAVIRDLSGPPNFWDPATIEHNIFRKYDRDLLNATQLDPKSIMMYRIPASWTTNGFSTEFNADLSTVDKTFIGTEGNYPFGTGDNAVDLTVTQTSITQGEIGQPGEQDLYRFAAATAGHYSIQTEGATDLVMSLYGPDSRTTLIAEDDDSGVGRNPKIAVDLAPGTYYVQIRHYNRNGGTGTYGVSVSV